MKNIRLLLLIVMSIACNTSAAVDYLVDFTRIGDLESVRPLVERCNDFGALEFYRERMESAGNLESMRATLTRNGLGMFNECPDGISGSGIAQVRQEDLGNTTP